MDPITLIVTALTAGAALGVQDTASAMVRDTYADLVDPGAHIRIVFGVFPDCRGGIAGES